MEHMAGGPQEPARRSQRRRGVAWQGRRGAGKGRAPSLPPGPGAPALVLEGVEVRAVQMPSASEVMNTSNVP